jgi:thiamine-monophosphate kinase
VVCTDQVVWGVHYAPGLAPARVGRKAVDRALSDLAATAALPRAVLLALRAPASTAEARVRGLVRGVETRARELGAELVGGDLTSGAGPESLAVTALGVWSGRGRPPGRDRARPGQRVLLTGAVGGSSLGRHLAIEPRLELGRWLRERGATALMDVSDGLARDLARLARASRVRIDLDLERVPVHADAVRLARRTGRAALEHALSDGEDHELLATAPARAARALLADLPRAWRDVVQIGRVSRGSGLWLALDGAVPRRWDGRGGWVHGG